MISGIVFVIRNGLRWRDVPSGNGPRKTVYNRFVREVATVHSVQPEPPHGVQGSGVELLGLLTLGKVSHAFKQNEVCRSLH